MKAKIVLIEESSAGYSGDEYDKKKERRGRTHIVELFCVPAAGQVVRALVSDGDASPVLARFRVRGVEHLDSSTYFDADDAVCYVHRMKAGDLPGLG